MINSKFSLLQAYFVGIKMMLEYISFYIVWYSFTTVLWFAFFLGFGLYAELLNFEGLATNWSWIGSMVQRWIPQIKLTHDSIPAGLSLYDLLKYCLPVDILNHSLETMSWKEYLSIIIVPKKITLLFAVLGATYISMTTSIGFIKTALSFQSNKQASFSDLYRYFYLVPEYFIAKAILFFVCLVPYVLLLPLHAFFAGTSFLVLVAVVTVLVVCLYQRLRFAKYFVIDNGMNAVDAATASWKLTQGSVIHLFVFSLCAVTIATHYLSALLIFFFVGLDKQAEVSIYRQLTGKKQA